MQIGATENNKRSDIRRININEIQTNNCSHLSLSACAAFLIAGMEQLFIGEKFKFKNANCRLQGLETGNDGRVMGLVPKERLAKRSTGRKSSITCLIRIGREVLAVINVEARKSSERGQNDCKRASN